MKFIKTIVLLALSVATGNSLTGTEHERAIRKSAALSEVVLHLIATMANERGRISDEISIHQAAYEGYDDTVRQLLAAGTEVDEKNRLGQTPFHCAVRGVHPVVARLLKDAGADIHKKNLVGNTVLHQAVEDGRPRSVRLTLALGLNVDERDDQCKQTALHMAAIKARDLINSKGRGRYREYINVIKLLLVAGADPDNIFEEDPRIFVKQIKLGMETAATVIQESLQVHNVLERIRATGSRS